MSCSNWTFTPKSVTWIQPDLVTKHISDNIFQRMLIIWLVLFLLKRKSSVWKFHQMCLSCGPIDHTYQVWSKMDNKWRPQTSKIGLAQLSLWLSYFQYCTWTQLEAIHISNGMFKVWVCIKTGCFHRNYKMFIYISENNCMETINV